MRIDRQTLTRQAMVAALYAVLTWAIPTLSYGPIQFRVSEVMTMLAFFNPVHIIGLTVGCAIANLFSTLGMVDVIVGTLASFLAVTAMSRIRNIWIASLMPALFSIIIGLEIMFVSPVPIAVVPVTLQIMISEFIIVTVLGVPLFRLLEKNQMFNEIVLQNKSIKSARTI